jgi:hypothetical protein
LLVISFAHYIPLGSSNPSSSFVVPKLKRWNKIFIRVDLCFTRPREAYAHTYKTIIYTIQLEKITTWVKMGELENGWTSKVELVGLFEV